MNEYQVSGLPNPLIGPFTQDSVFQLLFQWSGENHISADLNLDHRDDEFQ